MKLQYLTRVAPEYIEELKHGLKLKKYINKYRLVRLIAEHVSLWKEISFILTLVINFFVLTSYSSYVDGADRASEPSIFYQQDKEGTENFLRSLGIA
jgi:hypothetical protein